MEFESFQALPSDVEFRGPVYQFEQFYFLKYQKIYRNIDLTRLMDSLNRVLSSPYPYWREKLKRDRNGFLKFLVIQLTVDTIAGNTKLNVEYFCCHKIVVSIGVEEEDQQQYVAVPF